MKTLLDRADAALKLRREKLKQSSSSTSGRIESGMEGLVDDTRNMSLEEGQGQSQAQGQGHGDEWEVLQHDNDEEEQVAIRVDQYLVVFLKFIASVTPGIEHDFTMGV